MKYILFLLGIAAVYGIASLIFYYISGLLGLKNDRFRILIPFLATVLILVFVGALLGWFS
tara:strand:- start:366 stop:545 length:180 start_codon:yes stop_codon:yes gene_type:complete